MSDIETAALRLALFALAFIAILFAVVWLRRPRAERAMPRLPVPVFRAPPPPVEEVEIAPSRLARIAAKPVAERISEPDPVAPESFPPDQITPDPIAPDSIGNAEPDTAEPPPFARPTDASTLRAVEDIPAAVRLVPRTAPHDADAARNRLGGRPRLPAAMEWPQADGRDGDFLAQIACADLPAALWDGLGPRVGSLLLFANPDSGAPTVLHIDEDGPPRDPPRAPGVLWSGPEDDLASLARHAFPEWAIDVVPDDAETPEGAGPDAATGYDVADAAFHPFDWDSMLALAGLLESRIARLTTDAAPPADANDELLEAIAEAAETNREAHQHAREIIAIIRESAGEPPFASPLSAEDAAAVMAGLHAIRWTSVTAASDPETGEDHVETATLPLTRHHPGANLWVEDYRRLLIDHAKHVWCADPDSLSPVTRTMLEPLWHDMAAREAAAAMGGRPDRPMPGFDADLDALLFVLPASALMNRALPGGRDMHVAIRKADLAMGDFSRLRLLAD